MLNPHLERPDPPDALEPIVLSDEVVIDFHQGAGGMHWATLHTGPNATEVGTVRNGRDINTVLTIVAGILMERTSYPDAIYISADSTERWVLIGRWLLNARLGASKPDHLHAGTTRQARDAFNRRAGRGKGTSP
jgi:hypothetical protein